MGDVSLRDQDGIGCDTPERPAGTWPIGDGCAFVDCIPGSIFNGTECESICIGDSSWNGSECVEVLCERSFRWTGTQCLPDGPRARTVKSSSTGGAHSSASKMGTEPTSRFDLSLSNLN